MLEAGRSYSDALAFAEALAESLPTFQGAAIAPSSGAGATSAQLPTGRAAMAAHSPTGGHPTTMAEYYEIARSDRARFAALKKDPTFDPTSLR